MPSNSNEIQIRALSEKMRKHCQIKGYGGGTREPYQRHRVRNKTTERSK
jgi:hypothetical protein